MNTLQWLVIGYIAVLLVSANLPWITQGILFVFTPRTGEKRVAGRLLEWFLMYGLMLGLGMGLELKETGTLHSQGVAFYVITLVLFAVFAFPGFIYHFDLRRHLMRRHVSSEMASGG
ncbi:MAG: DUF2818 family protein [Ectothiorhodospira sp.]